MIEYAFILPFLLLLTFSIIEGGFLFARYNTVSNAAREGARAGIVPVSKSCDAACVRGKAETAAKALAIGLVPVPTVQVSPLGVTNDTVVVTVTYDANLVTGTIVQALGGTKTIQLQAVATMQRE